MIVNEDKKYSEPVLEEVKEFTEKLRRGNLTCSYTIATTTIKLLRKIISTSKWRTAKELMALIKHVGLEMIESQPIETCTGNMVRTILKIIKEEYASAQKLEGDQESLHKMISAKNKFEGDYNTVILELKASVIDSIGETLAEIENSVENISQQAEEHIHANEVIMTIGRSKTVEAFLQRVARKRKFHVFIVECAPFFEGHGLALNLADAGIEITIITDSAVFAMMSRVNKVITGTHSVLANGGLKAISGSHTLALAAKHYSVPVFVCTAMYKFSPQYLCSYDQDSFNKFVSPQSVIDYSEGTVLSKVQVCNPVFDYVPPELITLFISNIGGNSPSYVYRLLSELYDPSDYELTQSPP